MSDEKKALIEKVKKMGAIMEAARKLKKAREEKEEKVSG